MIQVLFKPTLDLQDNLIYIRDNLASGDLELRSGNDIGANDGNITLEANTGLINLNADRIHIGAQSSGSPASGIEADIYYDTTSHKLRYRDFDSYRDIDGGDITSEFTGFPNKTDSAISWVDGTRTFSIAPTGVNYKYYIKGTAHVITTTKNVVIPDDTGMHFIYFNGETLVSQVGFTPLILKDYAYVGNIYWNSANAKAIIIGDERHGLTMDWATHSYLHANLGLRIADGLSADNFTIIGDGSADAHAQLGINGGTITDEDLAHSIVHSATPSADFQQVLNVTAKLPAMYKFGANNAWTKDTSTNFPFKIVASVPQYNYYNGGTTEWELLNVTDGNFFVVWVFVTNSIDEPVVALMGQDEYANLTDAQENGTYGKLVFGEMPSQEISSSYRLIFEYNTTFTNSVDVALREINDVRSGVDRLLGTYTSLGDHGLLSGLTDQDHPASSIFTNVAGFGGTMLTSSETDVQLALNRLDLKSAKINLINVEHFAANPALEGSGLGQVFFDTVNNVYKYYDGTAWKPLGNSSITNADRNTALLGGATIKWKASTTTLSWSADAYIQTPGVAESRNRIVAGSFSLPNDGDVAYVDINRTAGAAATITPVVVNITALGTLSPANENRFVIARRHAGDVYWGLNDGQRISGTDGGVLIEFTLADNTTAGLIFAEDATDNDTMIVKYSLKRGNAVEVGHLYITNDGTIAGVSGAANELATVGVTFSAVISGANVELRYDTTSTGTAVEMRYIIEKWDAS